MYRFSLPTVFSRAAIRSESGQRQKEIAFLHCQAGPQSVRETDAHRRGQGELGFSIRENVAAKEKIEKKKRKKLVQDSFSIGQDFTENVHLTTLRAMTEYSIRPEDLEGLPEFTRRSPFEDASEITVYLRCDVEKKAIEVFGSREKLEVKHH